MKKVNIELTDIQTKNLIEALDDDINYKISESGCANEYEKQIRIYIMLLEKLGEADKAKDYIRKLKTELI